MHPIDGTVPNTSMFSADKPTSYPEVFPPGTEIPQPDYGQSSYSYRPPPPAAPPRRQRRGWASAPATYLLVAINCAVFLLMVLRHVPILDPGTDQLIYFQANSGDLVLDHHQWWRLVTGTFVHVGAIHLGTNMWCLWNLGLLGEPLLGPWGLLATYLLTGTAGNLLSTAVNRHVVGAGASGAVFGIAGVLILLLNSPLLPVPRAELKQLRKSVIYFAALNFIIGASTYVLPSPVRIDNMAHLGGFICGVLIGLPLLPRLGTARDKVTRRQLLTFGASLLAVLLCTHWLAAFHPQQPDCQYTGLPPCF